MIKKRNSPKNRQRVFAIVTAMAVFFCTNAIYPLATENIAKPPPREAAEAEAALADVAEDTIKDVPEEPSKDAPRVTVTVLLASEDLPAARQWLETIKKAGEELTLSLLDEETDAGERGLLKAMLAASRAADLDGFF
ncbi:MAG: hypothetical protein LBI54_08805, partial [Lachnospiraceae bacterium]|nr:hypothetical protein [Lachnospiraceae bacterium]